MLKRIRAVRDGDKGFTLTELLITIVILGVLAGIVVFAVSNFSKNGETAACQTDKKNVEIAVEAYFAQKSFYPTKGSSTADLQELVDTKYLKELPSTAKYTIVLADTGVVTSTSC